MRINKPIFIVGCGRSGTTLLFDLLSQHPDLARTKGYPDGEDHHGWIQHGHCAMAGIGNVSSAIYGNGINGYHYCLHMTEQDASPEAKAGMHAYYEREVLGTDANKRVLNKQPHLSNKLTYLKAIFPDAFVIHIIRDCQPTVASWVAVMKSHPALVAYWPRVDFPCFWLLPKPEDASVMTRLARDENFYPGGGEGLWVDYWCATNMNMERQLAGSLKQFCTVRYEDLVREPARMLRRLAEFCELPEFAFETSNVKLDTATTHEHLLGAELKARIATQAAPVRRYFGYEKASWPWSARTSTLLDMCAS